MTETAKVPVKADDKGRPPAEVWPFDELRREIGRLFDNFSWGRSGRSAIDVEPFWRGEVTWGKAPAVDIVDTDKSYEVTVELPGIDVANINVKHSAGLLSITGEKKEEKEEKKKDYFLSERRYGSFQRSFQIPNGMDADKIEANFKNGILTVTLPKNAETVKREKKIEIKTAA